MPAECLAPWFAGLTKDHLYADCPSRIRARAELTEVGWWEVGTEYGASDAVVDVHGTDICGMCVHGHNRKHHARTTESEEVA